MRRVLPWLLAGSAVLALVLWSSRGGSDEWYVTPTDEVASDAWQLRNQSRARVDGANRVATMWVAEGSDGAELATYVDEYPTDRSARRHSNPPDKSLSAPNFEIRGFGDVSRIPLDETPWMDFVVCGDGDPDACSWWAYYAEFGRFRVTVVYRDFLGRSYEIDAFSSLALDTFDATTLETED